MLCAVTVEAWRGDAPGEVTEEAVDKLADLVESAAGVIAAAPGYDRWSVTLDIRAHSITGAVGRGVELIMVSAREAGMPSWPVVRVEAVRADVQEATLTTLPPAP
jgi:hypothetical protein